MFRILIILSTLFLGSLLHGQGWDMQVIDPNMRLTDVHAISADEAVAIGYELVLDGRAAVYRTIDGGASWDTVNTINAGVLREVDFINSQTGWTVGWELDPLFHIPEVTVWKTENSGLSWTRSSSGLELGQGSVIEMVSDTKGWIFGETNQLFETEVYCLESGSPNWQADCPLPGIDRFQSGVLRDMFFLDNNYGWIAAPPDTIYLTTNGGTTWTARSIPTIGGLDSRINFVDQQHGWLVDEGGIYLRTTDGGLNWTEETSIGTLSDIQFLTTNSGWSVGEGGLLQYTTDGGGTWIQQAVTTQKLNALSFISADTGYVVGEEGIVLKTVNGGVTGIGDQVPETTPSSIRLLANYPNPFNPSTTLRFELYRRSEVLLQITDISGRLVRILVNNERSAGMHDVKWDGRDETATPVASGVYLSQLESGGEVQSQKILLVR
ncbi:MAG: YCF48-related protein [Calditrichia bacterium]